LLGTAVYDFIFSLEDQNLLRKTLRKGMKKENGYQPMDILIKASNGASDFGNKFGQPLNTGSVLTFEHEEDALKLVSTV
jgi:phosphoribosylformylglycinamidine synthase